MIFFVLLLLQQPERIEPKNTKKGSFYDIRADVWSFGLTLVEMSKGTFPYHANDQFALVTAIVWGDPPQPDSQRFSLEFCDFCRLWWVIQLIY